MPDVGAAAAVYIAREWIPKLAKELARISAERGAKLDQLAFDFPNPQELARYYVEPNCQLRNPANLDDAHDPHCNPAFKIIDHHLRKPSLDPDGSGHLIVLGDAGMGKSSLLIMLWKMHLFGFWPTDVECTLLKLGPDTLAQIAELATPARHILLLDALDEDSSVSVEVGGAQARLVELIRASKSFRKVIISCRTQFFVDEDDDPAFAKLGCVRLDGFTCPITYLSPFDDRQAEDLLRKRFPDTWRNYLLFQPNIARQKAKGIAEAMGSLNMRPLLLSYIPFLLGNDPSEPDPLDIEGEHREYEIYRLLITRWLDREVIKIRDSGATVVPSADDLREFCWQVATHMRLDGYRKMPRAAFETLKIRVGVPEFLADHTLEGRALLNKDSAGNFRFAHYSLQEFLVVEYCLVRGVFIRGVDSKHDLCSSALMRRFYEQRSRTNFNSVFQSARSNRIGKFAFKPSLFASEFLLYVSIAMIDFLEVRKHPDGLVPALGERDWSTVVCELISTKHGATMTQVAERWKAKHRRGGLLEAFINNLDMANSGHMDEVVRTYEKLGLTRAAELVNELRDERLAADVNIDLFVIEQDAGVRALASSVATLAAQLAAGAFNLGISGTDLATISYEELQKAWPNH